MQFVRSLAAICLAACLTSSSSATTLAEIQTEVDTILARPAISAVNWTILMQNDTGTVTYYSRDQVTGKRPASNTKIFTSAGAFGLLGPNHVYRKTTIQEYCRTMNKSSDNAMADDLLVYIGSVIMGGKGTYAKGATAIFNWCNSIGVDMTGARMDDGSGLDYDNRFSADQITELLRYMSTNFPTYDDTLPIGCVDGTLSSRFCNTDGAGCVLAKTGTLPNGLTIALSGYVNNKYDGRRYLFSFIANNASDLTATRIAIDDAVLVLCHAGIDDGSGGSSGTTVIVDNAEPAFSASTSWSASSATAGYYGTDYRYRSTQAVNDAATWTAALPASGTYQVYARWTAGTNRSSTAPFIISHASGSSTVSVNQQLNGGSWQLLGSYSFNAGTATVQLSCWTTAGYVVLADAIKFVSP